MKKVLAAVLVLLMLTVPALAAVIKPTSDAYVYDEVGVLDDATKGMIIFSNDLLKKACGAEIAVVVVDSTGSESIDDYCLELFNEWGIGSKKKNNGFLLLLAIGDDNYYMLPGTGLDAEMSGGTLKTIMDTYLEPDFAAKDYDAGVGKTFCVLLDRISDICGANVTAQEGVDKYNEYAEKNKEPAYEKEVPKEEVDTFDAVLGFFVLLLIIYAVCRPFRRLVGFLCCCCSPSPRRDVWRGVPGSAPRPPYGSGHVRTGGYRSNGSSFGGGRSFGGGSSYRSGSSRSSFGSSSSRSSFGSSSSRSSSRSSFGGGRSFGGGGSRGGGAGRGR